MTVTRFLWNFIVLVAAYFVGLFLYKYVAEKRTLSSMSGSEQSAYDFTVKDVDGQDVSLAKYKGFVTVMVNVASKCGFTDGHYKQLQELYGKYADQGLRIAAFPCNQFGSQEPNAACEVKKDMGNKFKVTFDFYDKIDVNGDHAHPLFTFLKKKQGGTLGDFIKWNFTKFLVDRQGQPINRYSPQTNPKDMEKDIVKALNGK